MRLTVITRNGGAPPMGRLLSYSLRRSRVV